MSQSQRFGRDASLGRRHFALSIASLDELPQPRVLDEGAFAALVLIDASAETVEALASLVERLLEAGCVYLTTWGVGAERLHDIADEVIVSQGLERGVELDVMTTWLEGDPLDDALWQHLHLSEPFEVHEAGCRTGLVLAVEQPVRVTRRLEFALRHPERFSTEVLRQEPD